MIHFWQQTQENSILSVQCMHAIYYTSKEVIYDEEFTKMFYYAEMTKNPKTFMHQIHCASSPSIVFSPDSSQLHPDVLSCMKRVEVVQVV